MLPIIPVIDLRAGIVVHARRGERERYQPVRSRLAAGSAPVPIARALLDAARADRLYVADLDAIAGAAPQASVLHALLNALPGVTLWLDAGFADRAAARAVIDALDHHRVVPVYGSESLASRAALADAFAGGQRAVLSLDRRGDALLDRAGCWQASELWPADVIVMTLDRVGSDVGVDLHTLAQVKQRAPRARVFGAGGVRDAADLAQAEQAGAAGWLVASALHAGQLAIGHGVRATPTSRLR